MSEAFSVIFRCDEDLKPGQMLIPGRNGFTGLYDHAGGFHEQPVRVVREATLEQYLAQYARGSRWTLHPSERRNAKRPGVRFYEVVTD